MNPKHRPWHRAARALGVFCALGATCAALGAGARAQTVDYPQNRVFPVGSLQGLARFASGPSMMVNCQSFPLGPGVRAHTPDQRLLLRGQLAGQRGRVVFRRDSTGNVFQIWFLAPNQSAPDVPEVNSRCLFMEP